MRCCRPGHASWLIGLSALALCAGAADAAVIEPGPYRLHNHPDGSPAPPLFGLRLDELFDFTPDHDVVLFDFDHPEVAMFMEYDGASTVHIYGTAFGGLDAGAGFSSDPKHTSFVTIDFTYTTVGRAPGDDDLLVTTPTGTNSGTITWQDTGEVIDLFDRRGGIGYSFRLGDEDGNVGHRGTAGISGWGWLDHHVLGDHVYHSDWLFTAEFIPAPPALVILATGLLAAPRRRRR